MFIKQFPHEDDAWSHSVADFRFYYPRGDSWLPLSLSLSLSLSHTHTHTHAFRIWRLWKSSHARNKAKEASQEHLS